MELVIPASRLSELSTGKVEIAGIAPSSNGLWMNQIGRNLTDVVDGILKGKRYLIHDRDPLFTTEFLQTLADCGVASVKLPPRSPNLARCGKRLPNSSRITIPSATTKVWIMHGSVLTLGMRSSKAKCIGRT